MLLEKSERKMHSTGMVVLPKEVDSAPIIAKEDVITAQWIQNFKHAVRSGAIEAIPLTFATVFRKADFTWLERLKVDFRKLLHTDQEYQYIEPLEFNSGPEVETSIVEYRARKGLLFVRLESKVFQKGNLKIVSHSSFIVRS